MCKTKSNLTVGPIILFADDNLSPLSVERASDIQPISTSILYNRERSQHQHQENYSSLHQHSPHDYSRAQSDGY